MERDTNISWSSTNTSCDPAKPYPALLSEDEAIDALRLGDRKNPKGALRWLIRQKRLGTVKLGRGIYRFRPEDIQQCINRGLEKAR